MQVSADLAGYRKPEPRQRLASPPGSAAQASVGICETRVGKGSCALLITADSDGAITNLEATQDVRGRTDSLLSTGLAPNAQNAADGLALVR